MKKLYKSPLVQTVTLHPESHILADSVTLGNQGGNPGGSDPDDYGTQGKSGGASIWD